MKMKNNIFTILIPISLIVLMGFISKNDYSPMIVHLKGTIINLKTGKPIKKSILYFNEKEMNEIDFRPDDSFIDNCKTNSKGDFLIDTYLDKNKFQTWLKVEEFAQINILMPNIDTTNDRVIIDLGKIYVVPYDIELEVESHNMPTLKKKKKLKYEKYSINEVDSIFNLTGHNYDMELNQIDTISGLITRYNFGHDRPRGTTIKKYKQITFSKTIE